MNASEDRMISERDRWKESVRFLQDVIIDRIKQSLSHDIAKRLPIFTLIVFQRNLDLGIWSGLNGWSSGVHGNHDPDSSTSTQTSKLNLIVLPAKMLVH